jgi:AcrR family transcriptional regulator
MSEAPRTAKGRATRDRIVAAAAALTFERGVAGTSIDDVKAAAGVSSSQLYHYFADKHALVRAVIGAQTEAVLGNQAPYFARLDSLAGLRAWADAIIGLQRERGGAGGCPIGSLASELADVDEACRADLADGFARWEAALRDGLRAMHHRGELRADADPDRLAAALLTTLQGGLLLCQLRRDTAALEAGLAAMLEHIAAQAQPATAAAASSPSRTA